MSILQRKFSIKLSKTFSYIYKSRSVFHTKTFILFIQKNKQNKFSIAFVASKKVGNAVVRNKSKRHLKAACLYHKELFGRYSYVFVAKKQITATPFAVIKKDIKFALDKMSNKLP